MEEQEHTIAEMAEIRNNFAALQKKWEESKSNYCYTFKNVIIELI